MKQEMQEGSGGRRRGIQSVEIGLRVLQSLSALGVPSSLSAVAQQDPGTTRYDLGPAAIMLGLGALARTDAFRLVDALIADFTVRSGQTVQIAALGPLGPTIVRWYPGTPAVAASLSVGSVLSLIHSATGRVFLAFAAAAETQDLLKKEQRRSPLTKGALDGICAHVRADGRAEVSGTVIPGLSAVAFPIFNLQARPVLSATLLWPGILTDGGQASAADELASICVQISAQLGWLQASS
ncbi:IclR family transcriptional regulator [soil metagenome]